MKNKNRIIVLGSNGFVGGSVLRLLQKKKYNCIGVSRKKMDFLKISSIKKLSKLIKKGDVVVNAVAIAPCKNLEEFEKNLIIIKNIQKGLEEKKIKKYINISSDAVYGDKKIPLTETDIPNSSSIHGLMHCNREKIINFTTNNSIDIIHVRPTLIYGIGDPHSGYGPNLFLRTMKEKKKINIFGNGDELRDHICIDDVSFLIVELIKKKFKGPINLVTSKGITFYRIARIFVNINKEIKIVKLKRKIKKPHGGYRLFNNKNLVKLFPKFKFSNIENKIIDMVENARN